MGLESIFLIVYMLFFWYLPYFANNAGGIIKAVHVLKSEISLNFFHNFQNYENYAGNIFIRQGSFRGSFGYFHSNETLSSKIFYKKYSFFGTHVVYFLKLMREGNMEPNFRSDMITFNDSTEC